MSGSGTTDDPWVLTTPSGGSEYQMHVDPEAGLLVCQVGKTKLTYLARALDDLHAWLAAQGDWVLLGGADEQKPAAEGTVEAWGRAEDNPVGGWYGQKKGLRGRGPRRDQGRVAQGVRPSPLTTPCTTGRPARASQGGPGKGRARIPLR